MHVAFQARVGSCSPTLQAISTRTAGFDAVDISTGAPAMWVMWAVFMYLSAYPIKLVLRSTDVSQESKEETLWVQAKPNKSLLLMGCVTSVELCNLLPPVNLVSVLTLGV